MGNAVYESDSGLNSAINVNGGYSIYSNCAFLACALAGTLLSAFLSAASGQESSPLSRSLRGIACEI
jgi:hypothetical protein